MTLYLLLIVLLIGGAVIYFIPDTKKVVWFVWVVCALAWLADAFGKLPSSFHIN
jgi:hypothetical protein